jgi:hypothetical protein
VQSCLIAVMLCLGGTEYTSLLYPRMGKIPSGVGEGHPVSVLPVAPTVQGTSCSTEYIQYSIHSSSTAVRYCTVQYIVCNLQSSLHWLIMQVMSVCR